MTVAKNKPRLPKIKPKSAASRRPGRNGARARLNRALKILRRHRGKLAAMGVVHAGVFGSLARGDAGAKSDVDVFVVLDDSLHLSVYDFVGIQHYLQEVLHPRVDLVERDALRPPIREAALADAVNAF
jgi:hypothetical protein